MMMMMTMMTMMNEVVVVVVVVVAAVLKIHPQKGFDAVTCELWWEIGVGMSGEGGIGLTWLNVDPSHPEPKPTP